MALSSQVQEARWQSSVLGSLAGMFHGRRLGVGLILLLLVVWELSVRSGWVVSSNWPAVSTIVLTAGKTFADGELLTALGGTLYRMAAGFIVGAFAGIVAGMAMTASPLVRKTLEPTIELLRPMPVPALIPPLILFLGTADAIKITVVAFTVFFPVLINTVQGGLSVEPTYRAVAATFGFSWFDRTRKVIFPATLPYIFAGLRISLSLAFVVAVVGEMIAGGNGGLGLYIVTMEYAGRAAEMYVAIILLGICGYLLNRVFLGFERAILFWHAIED